MVDANSDANKDLIIINHNATKLITAYALANTNQRDKNRNKKDVGEM